MWQVFKKKNSKKAFSHIDPNSIKNLVLVAFLTLSITIGVYLSGQPQIFKNRAFEGNSLEGRPSSKPETVIKELRSPGPDEIIYSDPESGVKRFISESGQPTPPPRMRVNPSMSGAYLYNLGVSIIDWIVSFNRRLDNGLSGFFTGLSD